MNGQGSYGQFGHYSGPGSYAPYGPFGYGEVVEKPKVTGGALLVGTAISLTLTAFTIYGIYAFATRRGR